MNPNFPRTISVFFPKFDVQQLHFLLPCFFICTIAYGHWLLSYSIQAAIKNYHRLGGLNNKHLFLTILEAGKSKVKVLADLVSSEDSSPGLQSVVFWLYSHMAKKSSLLCFFS